MKTFHLAVVLLVICISTTMALKCNRCVPASPGGRCFNSVETCQRDEVCASVTSSFLNRVSHFKRCMKESDAFILKANPNFSVYTCTRDRCN